jgi:hypothetical protein
MVDEYYFLVNFLDKIFLKLLGYTGPYNSWRRANGAWEGRRQL